MSTMEKINEVLEFARQENIALSTTTEEAQRELLNPHTTMALIGCYQVGKTTLLNKGFLGEELLLKEGDGRCTTAVVTKLVYGQQKRLTVKYRDDNRASDVYEEDAISEELITRLTTVDDPDEMSRQAKRTEIARTIKYIQIEYPCEALRQNTFYDTPGVDDPNQELIDMTTRLVLSEADLVILVVPATTTLNSCVKEFLSQCFFQEGLSRVMVMTSYRPEHNLPAESRAQILQAIRAELTSMGRGYIPVVSFTFDGKVDGEILHGSTEIQPTVLEYIDKNKRSAREERLAWFLCNDLMIAREKLKAALLASSQTEKEREELLKKIESMVEELDFDYKKTLDNFRISYLQIKTWLGTELQAQLLDDGNTQSILCRFMAKFDNCETLADVRNQIDTAAEAIKPEIESTILRIVQETQRKIEVSLATASDDAKNAGEKVKISTQWNEGEISTGWTGKIHPGLIRVAEIAVSFWVFNLPGALVAFFGKNIPLLKNLLPTTFMKSMVLSSVKTSFTKSLESVRKDVFLQFDMSQQAIEAEIKKIFQNVYNVQLAPYQEQLQSGAQPLSQDEKTKMETTIQQCNQFLEDLNVF